MKKIMVRCIILSVLLATLLIPGNAVLAFDSKTIYRSSEENVHFHWRVPVPGPVNPDSLIIYNLHVNKNNDGTYVYLNIDTYYGEQIPPPGVPQEGYTATTSEWGYSNAAEKIYRLDNKMSSAQLGNITLTLFNNFSPVPRNVNIQANWTAAGTLTTEAGKGQEIYGDNIIKYTWEHQNTGALATVSLSDNSGTLVLGIPPINPPPPNLMNANLDRYTRTEMMIDK